MFPTDIDLRHAVVLGAGHPGLRCRSSMHNSKPESWREIAEAILQENDPDSVSRLVSELCEALDSGAAGTSAKGAGGDSSTASE
jgi:hypothetical protein